MGKTILRITLGTLFFTTLFFTLILAPGTAMAVGGAIQTISSGGKEGSLVGQGAANESERTMPVDFALDVDAHSAMCAAGTMDEMDCSPLVGGLDHAAAGTGLRNTGFGTVSLRGVPTGVKPVLARLYWGRILGRNENPSADKYTQLEMDGTKLEGRLLGTTESPCWSEANTFAAYSAAVPLALLRPGFNGDYGIALYGSVTTSGGDLFSTGRTAPLDEGVSLVVLYSNPDLPARSRVYLHTGPEKLVGRLILDQPLDPPLPTTMTFFRHTRIGGDGQRVVPKEAVRPYGTWIGNEERQVMLRGPSSKVDVTTDWNGDDSSPKNAMWDTQSNQWPSYMTPELAPGADSYRLEYWAIFPPDPPQPLGRANARPMAQPAQGNPTYWVDCVAVVAHVLTAG